MNLLGAGFAHAVGFVSSHWKWLTTYWIQLATLRRVSWNESSAGFQLNCCQFSSLELLHWYMGSEWIILKWNSNVCDETCGLDSGHKTRANKMASRQPTKWPALFCFFLFFFFSFIFIILIHPHYRTMAKSNPGILNSENISFDKSWKPQFKTNPRFSEWENWYFFIEDWSSWIARLNWCETFRVLFCLMRNYGSVLLALILARFEHQIWPQEVASQRDKKTTATLQMLLKWSATLMNSYVETEVRCVLDLIINQFRISPLKAWKVI